MFKITGSNIDGPHDGLNFVKGAAEVGNLSDSMIAALKARGYQVGKLDPLEVPIVKDEIVAEPDVKEFHKAVKPKPKKE